MLWRTRALSSLFWMDNCKEDCLAQAALQERGLSICNKCFLCEDSLETNNHLLLHCKFPWQTWSCILNIFGVSWGKPLNVKPSYLAGKESGLKRGRRRLPKYASRGHYGWRETLDVLKARNCIQPLWSIDAYKHYMCGARLVQRKAPLLYWSI